MAVTTRDTTAPTTQAPPAREIERRSIDWVPRSVRAKARSVERAYAELEASLGRAPSDADVAAQLQISESELLQTRGW